MRLYNHFLEVTMTVSLEEPNFHGALEPLSAYEKATKDGALDPRCIPQHLDAPPPIGDEILYPAYSEDEHQIWQFLYRRQCQLLPGRACRDFITGISLLGLRDDRIPALSDASRQLEKATGWRVARIPGLLHERDFFSLLAQRIFPSTDYIRGRHELNYTPAPDLFHDVFGHLPMLTHPDFADFYQLFGKAALHAEGQDRISLERLHWFTVEFGLIYEAGQLRIFGSGALSSSEEVEHALSDKVTVYPFEVERVICQDYDVWHLQDVLFVLDSFEQLKVEFSRWTHSRHLL
jgi:phenylalanine-4-hydroxylase